MIITLHSRLKAETAETHAQLESHPFHQALTDKRLPLVSFRSYLRCLSIIHATLERALERALEPRVHSVWNPRLAKLPLITNDLSHLCAPAEPVIESAIQAALQFSAKIIPQLSNPIGLVGYLYVLEGSQNGGPILRRLYSDAFKIPVEQLSYFGSSGERTRENWKNFVDSLNRLELAESEADFVVDAAKTAFIGIGKVLGELYPVNETTLKFHVTTINPEAGSHRIPDDPKKVELALRAGAEAWSRYPYLEARFSERGKRFTSSDSCWLVSLIPLKLEAIRASIFWLRGVLAVRGLPSIILETHMFEIARMYEETFPKRVSELANFRSVATALKADRTRKQGESWFDELGQRWDARLDESANTRVGSIARLLASARADEASGIAGAFAAVLSWCTEAGQFSNEWISEVQALAAEIELMCEASE